ncbi:hypothetical protein N7532_007383 [Penicillium argentinense]|uniref:Uncharacterized protein n=1 Tax=Penicillium argentinense TaxID=1131581 RepID=A0A9W9F7U9_9EURO|nr:uncharacterized protein N7532_007383 [Penicillium argentinense]KAJ5095092.1 hypothetical protein N7532_007383 [Penicillium argentinense]
MVGRRKNRATSRMVAPAPSPRGRGTGRGSRSGSRGGRGGRWATRGQAARAARVESESSSSSSSDEEEEDNVESPPPEKRKRLIVRFKVPKATLRELHSPSEEQELEASTAQSSTPTGSANPETPMRRRSKRAMAVPESSRTTRQSARQSGRQSSRLKADLTRDYETPTKAGEPEQTDHDDEDDDEEFADGSSHKEEYDEDFEPGPQLKKARSPGPQTQATSPEQETRADLTTTEEQGDSTYSASAPTYSQEVESPKPQPSRRMSSPRLSRKRKSTEMKDESEGPETRAHSEPASKKPKIEEDEPTADADQSAVNGSGNEPTSQSQPVTSPDEPMASAEDDDATEAPPATTRGRGGRGSRGGYRGRGRGRGRGGRGSRGGALGPVRATVARARGRGRGRARASAASRGRGGKRIEDEIWDSECRRRTPSPIPDTQPIKSRQEELAMLFKKVGNAQQVALNVLADHTMTKLMRDKNAHKDCPEFAQVQRELAEYQTKALTRFRDEYDLKVDSENRVYAGQIHVVEAKANEQLENIQEEMFHAVRGKYMELVTGRRAAEDDEHTETDGSDPDAEEPNYLFRIGKLGTQEVERGFFAEAVRDPDGANAYDRGMNSWEDFLIKAQMGEDLNPQMQALNSAVSPGGHEARQTIASLLNAAEAVADEKPMPWGGDSAFDISPKALSMLADTALSEPTQNQSQTLLPRISDPTMSPASRQLLQSQPPPSLAHGPTDPRSFILPRPTPTQQPRRLLPARGQLGLPDPFSMTGPPQLPPPPGSNFQRLPPLPNYFPGPPAGAPPPPGHPAPPGPAQIYFQSPHGHSPHGQPPPPPPRRY